VNCRESIKAVHEETYVLITPVRNEEKYIENTIQAVAFQTILPAKWVIVSDGSTDRTDEIIKHHATGHQFIELLRLEDSERRDFSRKVYAVKAAYESLKHSHFDFIGFLDADISFDQNYYEKVLKRFSENPQLGIAGGVILEEHGGEFKKRFGNTDKMAAGANQLFRRACYENIGGFFPLKYGGEDLVACEMAKAHGWEVRSFPVLEVLHHRRSATGGMTVWRGRFRQGVGDYCLGYHPLFMLVKCLYRVVEKPYVLGSVLRLCGYILARLRPDELTLPDDFVRHLRQRQMLRLRSYLP
jgi:glycosyltransferase involved in cell wall biosynthesis